MTKYSNTRKQKQTRVVSASRNRKQKLSSTVVTVYKQKKPKQNKRKQPKLSQYVLATSNPFSQRAEGVRVPDPFGFPTVTAKIKGTICLSSVSTASTGSFILYPHPLLTFNDTTLLNTASTNFSISSSTLNYSGNTGLRGMCSGTSLNSLYSNYRVVAAGFKIRVQTAETSRTGRIMIAPVPMARDLPGYNALSSIQLSNTSGASYRLCAGVNPAVADSAAILELPESQEFTFAELGLENLILRCKPFASSVQNFHTSTNSSTYGGGENCGDEYLSNISSGVVDKIDTVDTLDMSGWNAWLVHIEGVPSSAPLIDIEVILHIEGQPVVSTLGGSGINPVPTGINDKQHTSTPFDSVLQSIRSLDFLEIERGMSAVNNAIVGMGNMFGSRPRYPRLM